jgi:hypothetical protein
MRPSSRAPCDRVGAARGVQLGQDVACVLLDSVDRHEEVFGRSLGCAGPSAMSWRTSSSRLVSSSTRPATGTDCCSASVEVFIACWIRATCWRSCLEVEPVGVRRCALSNLRSNAASGAPSSAKTRTNPCGRGECERLCQFADGLCMMPGSLHSQRPQGPHLDKAVHAPLWLSEPVEPVEDVKSLFVGALRHQDTGQHEVVALP